MNGRVFSSSMCYLEICLELLWIFQIKQAVPIVHNLAWASLKYYTWSEAFKFIVCRENFMIYLNGWFSGTNLRFVFSGRHYISEQVSVSLRQKSLLDQKRSRDFPGVSTIFKTYPNFLLSSPVTFPHYICWFCWLGEVMRGWNGNQWEN